MKIFAVILLLFATTLWGQTTTSTTSSTTTSLSDPGVPGFAKDQFRYYALMHHDMMNQSFLLDDHLIWTFETWAAVGLYGPPTIHGNFTTP